MVFSMMPKPFADKTGTGAHFNMSLYDLKTGKNLFACDPKDDPRGIGLTPPLHCTSRSLGTTGSGNSPPKSS